MENTVVSYLFEEDERSRKKKLNRLARNREVKSKPTVEKKDFVVIETDDFKKDYKWCLEQFSNQSVKEKFAQAIKEVKATFLAQGYIKGHTLMSSSRIMDSHILKPGGDWILLWRSNNHIIELLRVGTHAHLGMKT